MGQFYQSLSPIFIGAALFNQILLFKLIQDSTQVSGIQVQFPAQVRGSQIGSVGQFKNNSSILWFEGFRLVMVHSRLGKKLESFMYEIGRAHV